MRKIVCFLLLWLVASFALATDYESIEQINFTNWASYFDELAGFPYDSHGCLHFTPSDVYLLYKTLPEGIPLRIKKYELKKDEPPFPVEKVPYLIDLTNSTLDVEKHARMFKAYKTEILVYPSLDRLFILVNGYPYAQAKALAGQPYEYLMAYSVEKGKAIEWDIMLSTPTDAGEYTILRKTDHYLSSAYYRNTVVPFGAWLKKVDGTWLFQKNDKWYKLPDYIAADLSLPADQREYNYYDARYAGHDFGKYVILWTEDGKSKYPEMGYAAGELVFEQIILIKDLVHLLTMSGPDDFDSLVDRNSNFSFYRELYLFKNSKGEKAPASINPTAFSYYKLFNNLELSEIDWELIDPRVLKAYREYVENRLPRDLSARKKALGLYNYLRLNSLVIDKQAGWYEKVKQDWEDLEELRIKLREDFERMGVLSLENRQNLVEKWLFDRLEFKKVSPPREAKYVGELTFSSFFKPEEETTLFTERERVVMLERIRKAVKGEEKGLDLNIVKALNDYNFGILLNQILGDLYKSHGCLHVSPRNIIFLYDLLPIGAQVTIYKYTETISEEALKNIPYLANLVNFQEDLEKLKEQFAATSEVKIAVYPSSGYWLIYLKDQPFAKLRVKGGPQTKMYLLQGRNGKGKPIFENHLAYPTTTGTYYIFKKVKDYVSNIYRDTTIIPQGGAIKNQEGKWQAVPKVIEEDLKQPPEKRAYTYYDTVKNASGEVVEVRWGSHPFGTYALQTTVNRKTSFPELIHSSGDLIMEERSLISDLIKILTAPHDELDQCIKFSQNFELYKTCYDFVREPTQELIQTREKASYKLYFGLPLSSAEVEALPADVIVASKVLRKQKLSDGEVKLLIDEGIVNKHRGKLKINMEKIIGLQFDTYQYVVAIQKFAHHYETLKSHWAELSGLRQALLKDFNDFVLKDPQLFHNFMRELMLRRNNLERLSQEKALQILYGMLEQRD